MALASLAFMMTHWLQKLNRMGLPGTALDEFLWLDQYNWPAFGGHLTGFYRRNGYSAREVCGGGPDGGCVLVFCKGGKKTLVQILRWGEFQADGESVRKLCEMQAGEKADRAVLISSSDFTPEAVSLATGRPVILVDGAKCLDLASEFQKHLVERQTLPRRGWAGSFFPASGMVLGQSRQERFWQN